MKICTQCKELKEDVEFYKSKVNTRTGLISWCKPCCSLYHKNYRKRHKQKLDQRSEQWRKDNPRGMKENNLKRYHMSLQEFDHILTIQENKCPICTREFTAINLPTVDHDHNCCPGKNSCGRCNRGLLCHKCNLSIGGFDDDSKRLRVAAIYIEIYKNLLTFQKTRDTVLDEGKTK